MTIPSLGCCISRCTFKSIRYLAHSISRTIITLHIRFSSVRAVGGAGRRSERVRPGAGQSTAVHGCHSVQGGPTGGAGRARTGANEHGEACVCGVRPSTGRGARDGAESRELPKEKPSDEEMWPKQALSPGTLEDGMLETNDQAMERKQNNSRTTSHRLTDRCLAHESQKH